MSSYGHCCTKSRDPGLDTKERTTTFLPNGFKADGSASKLSFSFLALAVSPRRRSPRSQVGGHL